MYRRSTSPGQERRGTVAVMTAICGTGILFLTAMSIDLGNMMAARREAQSFCDAAALAATIKISTVNVGGTAATQAQAKAAAEASLSGHGKTSSNCTITVNYPPTSGSFQNTNSVEVYVQYTHTNLMLKNQNTVKVRAVASCAGSGNSSGPLIVLDPTAGKSFLVNSGKLTMAGPTAAPIQVNSNSKQAGSGGSATFAAAYVDGGVTKSGVTTNSGVAGTVSVVGDSAAFNKSGTTGSLFTPAAKTGGNPVADPYALMPEPTLAGLGYTTAITKNDYSSSGTTVINPGWYSRGLYCSTGNLTLNPGVYYIEDGNFWVNTPGQVKVDTTRTNAQTGNGVMIYHKGAKTGTGTYAKLKTSYNLDVGICLCLQGENYEFTPPNSGTWAGVSLFQSRSYSGQAFYDFFSDGILKVGLQYFPNSQLRCWCVDPGAGNTIECNELVCKQFKLTGSHELGMTQNGGFSPLRWYSSRATNHPNTSIYLAE